MATRPHVLVFDALGTLVDLAGLIPSLQAAGLPAAALDTWYARTLRDGFAFAAAGKAPSFHAVAAGTLAELRAEHDLEPDPAAVEAVLSAFGSLALFDDVEPALIKVRDAGLRAVVLTNGDPRVPRRALERLDLQDHVQSYFGAQEIGAWKPLSAAYLHVSGALEVRPGEMALVAAHPWDLHGAHEAGLTTAWVDRRGAPWPDAMVHPDVRGPSLPEAVGALLDLPHAATPG